MNKALTQKEWLTYLDTTWKKCLAEAGLAEWRECIQQDGFKFATPDRLERFFHMAQAAERNKVANWMVAKGYATGHGDTTEDLLQELEWQVRESERNACAAIARQWDVDHQGSNYGGCIARLIEARGQA